MVKTPVEGNSIVILKMEQPVFFSDFARPVCLPSSDEFIHMGATCVTLGWSGQSKLINYAPKNIFRIVFMITASRFFQNFLLTNWKTKSINDQKR